MNNSSLYPENFFYLYPDFSNTLLALMEANLRHPGLKTHKYDSLTGPNKEEVFEAYVENRTPGAFRIFWYYGPDSGVITVFTITPHP